MDRQAHHNAPTPRASSRSEIKQARLARIAQSHAVPHVRVLPADENMRHILKHPRGWIAFRSSGSVEWPLDTFTRRRLRDGDITLEEERERPAPQQARHSPPTE